MSQRVMEQLCGRNLSVTQIQELVASEDKVELLLELVKCVHKQQNTMKLLSDENKKMKNMLVDMSHRPIPSKELSRVEHHNNDEDDSHYHLATTKILHLTNDHHEAKKELKKKHSPHVRTRSADHVLWNNDSLPFKEQKSTAGPKTLFNESFETYMSGSISSTIDMPVLIPKQETIAGEQMEEFPTRHSRIWVPPDPKYHKRRCSHQNHLANRDRH